MIQDQNNFKGKWLIIYGSIKHTLDNAWNKIYLSSCRFQRQTTKVGATMNIGSLTSL